MSSTQNNSGRMDALKGYLQKIDALDGVLTWLSLKRKQLQLRLCRVEKKKVVFSSYWGKGYGDNPKYIAEEILKQGLDWDLVWLTNGTDENYPAGIRCVRYGSEEAMRELASAKMWVDNVRNSVYPPKKKNQTYLQTWHGGVSFKCVEKAAEANLSKEYVDAAKRDGQMCDAIIAACQIQKEDFQENFWLNPQNEILEYGLPRNDLLFRQDWAAEKSRAIRQHFGIDRDTKIILYMPTFRDDWSMDGYKLDFPEIVRAMEERFGEAFVMLIRLHPNVQDQSGFITYSDKIRNATTWPDAQELYMAADYMISDYSSSALDFALLNRPVFRCMLDYDKYKKERGLNQVFDQCPFVDAYTNAQLLEAIRSFSEEDYWQRNAEFRKIWNPYDDGNAAKKTVEWMKRIIQG